MARLALRPLEWREPPIDAVDAFGQILEFIGTQKFVRPVVVEAGDKAARILHVVIGLYDTGPACMDARPATWRHENGLEWPGSGPARRT